MDDKYLDLLADLLDKPDELPMRLDVQDDHIIFGGDDGELDHGLSLEDAYELCNASSNVRKALEARLAAIQRILGVAA